VYLIAASAFSPSIGSSQFSSKMCSKSALLALSWCAIAPGSSPAAPDISFRVTFDA
jgi:hypothetical protein